MIEPDLLYTVLCDDVRREHNGKWILIGLFEQIAVSQFPAQHATCVVVNKWCNGEGNCTQQTRFVDGDDNVIVAGEPIEFELSNLLTHFTAVQVFAGLPLHAPGPMFVEVMVNGELKQRYALQVLQAT